MSSNEVLFEINNHIGFFTLNRPQALNALSHNMIKALNEHLDHCASDPNIFAVLLRGNGKAFCAGGDIKTIYKNLQDGNLSDAFAFFIDEYKLDFKIHTFPKPIIALMHGYVMGGGMGLAQGATVKIISETTSLAMPETAIGFFPDVGGSYFLSRCRGFFGFYMGITGLQINPDEALFSGLADYKMNQNDLAKFEGFLRELPWSLYHKQDILKAVNQFTSVQSNTPSDILTKAVLIDKHFSKASVKEIVDSLKSEKPSIEQTWLDNTLEAIHKRSPMSMVVTKEEIFRGKNLSLADCFRMELTMLNECFRRGDFKEGVRALLVDKDLQPKWYPESIDDVRPTDVNAFFERQWLDDDHPLRSL